MGEFELIGRYFQHALARPGARAGVLLGNGDDAALLQAGSGQALAVSSDMLVAGRHFFPDVEPAALGHKALAVNLSDLAAMGAQPLAFTLALALPAPDAAWLERFSAGLLALADAHGCALVGGDTTAGPLNLCLTVWGEVPPQQALRRSGAQVGDDVYVSGQLGLARLGLDALLGQVALPGAALAACRARLERPEPRVALGLALRALAHAAIDLSDGLLADLGHVLLASDVGALLEPEALLASAAVDCTLRALLLSDAAHGWSCLLAGGDDYELLFTAPVAARAALAALAQRLGLPLSRMGRIVPAAAVPAAAALGAVGAPARIGLLDARGQPYPLPVGTRWRGFDHFASP